MENDSLKNQINDSIENKSKSQFPLDQLPDELLWEIFKYLPSQDFFNMSIVNKQFNKLCNHNVFLIKVRYSF